MIVVMYTVILLWMFANTNANLHIGLLLPVQAPYSDCQRMNKSCAVVSLAIEEASTRYNQTIQQYLRDTACDEGKAMFEAYDLAKKENVSVIIGPACIKPLDIVAKLMSLLFDERQMTTFTWIPRSQKKSYPNDTVISTYASFDTIAKAFVTVLQTFTWKSVGIIAGNNELCVSVIESLNVLFPNAEIHVRRLRYIQTLSNQSITDALVEVKAHARKYQVDDLTRRSEHTPSASKEVAVKVMIICLQSDFLQLLLMLADSLGMHGNEYIFLYCRFGPSPQKGLNDSFSTMDAVTRERLYSGLLQLEFMHVDEGVYNDLILRVRNKCGEHCSEFCDEAGEFTFSLYETILLVADIFLNGTNLTMLDHPGMNRNFQTHYGQQVVDYSGKINRSIGLNHYQDGKFVTVSQIKDFYICNTSIKWPGGKTPSDTPECGWSGDTCSSSVAATDNNKNAAIIGSCVGVAVLLLLCGLIYGCYRKTKFEKELFNMIWKVNNNEIKMRRPRAATMHTSMPERTNASSLKKKLVRSDTRGTLGLGSTSSIDKTHLYAPVGSYKGAIVTVKNVKRTIQLTREMLLDLKTLRELQHENLNPFIGISFEAGNSYILMKYCSKGSLQDVLENDDIKLDHMFKMSFLMDLSRGVEFLHKSPIKSHGNLKSTNCVIDSRWVLKITDYGALCTPVEEKDESHNSDDENEFYAGLLWTAPELLRMHRRPPKGTPKADVYSFSIIMQEILLRCPPYYFNSAECSKIIVNRIRNSEDPPYRPRVTEDTDATENFVALMMVCWQECPDSRPDMHAVLKVLIDLNGRRKINIMDNMIKMLEAYSNNLEELVANRTEELALEKQKTDTLLYQMLPPSVAEQLKHGEHVVPETFSEASIFFSDIVGFTSLSSMSTPLQVIYLLNDLYTTFDEIISMHDVYKVETIGDAYMVSSGIPRRNGKRHAGEIANMALDLLSAVTSFRIRHVPDEKLQLRIGLHMGPCAAGVVGLKMPRYCLFGDTVNMASRMESTGKALHIHVSSAMYDALQNLFNGFLLMERGLIEVKGKGLQKTYWMIGKEGYQNTLPEEIQSLRRMYDEAHEKGRPLSPTDTHISSESQHESTSMYGNAFRRASYAITFLSKISNSSRESSPSGSRLTIQDLENDSYIQPRGSPDTNELKVPKLEPLKLSNKCSSVNDSLTVCRKKKARKKRQDKCENHFTIPKIEITQQK